MSDFHKNVEYFKVRELSEEPILLFEYTVLKALEEFPPDIFRKLWKEALTKVKAFYVVSPMQERAYFLIELAAETFRAEHDLLEKYFTKYAPVEAMNTFGTMFSDENFRLFFGKTIETIIKTEQVYRKKGDFVNSLRQIAVKKEDIEFFDTFCVIRTTDWMVEMALLDTAEGKVRYDTECFFAVGNIIRKQDPERFDRILDAIKTDVPEAYQAVCSLVATQTDTISNHAKTEWDRTI